MVHNLNDGGIGSLREKIILANTAGGTQVIQFIAGLSGAVDLVSALAVLTANVTIDGPTPAPIALRGAGTQSFGSVLSIDPNAAATLNNLAITGGDAPSGGGIFNSGTLAITDSTIFGNIGGGIFSSGRLTLTASTVNGNFTSAAGAGISNSGRATLINSTLTGNLGATKGGGIFSNGQVTVIDSTITGNSAQHGKGGGIKSTSSVIEGTIVASNAGGDLSGTNFGGANNLISDGSDASNFDSTLAGTPSNLLNPMTLTLIAHNGVSPRAMQTFTLAVS